MGNLVADAHVAGRSGATAVPASVPVPAYVPWYFGRLFASNGQTYGTDLAITYTAP